MIDKRLTVKYGVCERISPELGEGWITKLLYKLRIIEQLRQLIRSRGRHLATDDLITEDNGLRRGIEFPDEVAGSSPWSRDRREFP